MLALPAHQEQIPVETPKYIVTGDRIIGNNITDIPKLIDPIFPKVGVVAIAGSSDTGKSSLLRQLAMEIVSGKDNFLGFPIRATHRSVIYVSTEDDYYALSSIMKRQNVNLEAPTNFIGLRFIFDTTNIKEKIREELKREPADAIIFDAFSDLYGRDMNRANEVRNYIQDYVNMAIEHKCLVIYLHHTSKRTEDNPPSKHNVVGSQGFESKMRLVIELRRDYPNPNTQRRHFCIVKGNYLPDEFKDKSYVLNFSENMTFSNTNQRVPFEELAPSDRRGVNQRARERARVLRREGNTIDQIHDIMLEEGVVVSRSAIGNYVQGINTTE